MRNYFVEKGTTKIVHPRDFKGNFDGSYTLMGYNEKNEIVELEVSDKELRLDHMDKNYAQFFLCSAFKTPVIENWQFEQIPKRTIVKGTVNGQEISLKILQQRENYLKLEDGKTYFINWSNPSQVQRDRNLIANYRSYFPKFTKFCGYAGKIILPPIE